MPLAERRRQPAAPADYAETYFPQFFMGWAPLRSVRDGRWKFIDAPEPELYDLSADPGERSNLSPRSRPRARALRRELNGRPQRRRVSAAPLSDEARRRLSALGYVSAAAPQPPGAPAPDPKRMVALFEQLLEGNRALARGQGGRSREHRPRGAGHRRRQRLRPSPARPGAAGNRAATRRHRGAARLPGRCAGERRRPSLDGAGAAAARRPVRALAEEEAALALDPRHSAALSLRAGLLFSAGRKDDGVQSCATRSRPIR